MVKCRGGREHSTIVCLSLFFSIYISNYDIKVVRESTNWGVICTMYGFKLHHNVKEAPKKFSYNKIRTLKEEGGTSHVSQSYSQCRAVEEKNVSKQMIDWERGKIYGNISQWHLIGMLCVGIKYFKATK